MRFSMYWPKTWFSDRNFRFSSLTLSTRWERSDERNITFLSGYFSWDILACLRIYKLLEYQILVINAITFKLKG